MNTKKLIAIALILLLVFSLAACGNASDSNNDETRDTPEVGAEPATAPEEEPPVIEPPDDSGTDTTDPSEDADPGNEWPDNEFTRQVPKPDFAIITTVSSDSVFSAEFEIITESLL